TANPTRTALERCLSSLEGAAHGLAFASGMAACDALLRDVRPTEHVLIPHDAYGGTYRLVARVLGLDHSTVDFSDLTAVEGAGRRCRRPLHHQVPGRPLRRRRRVRRHQ